MQMSPLKASDMVGKWKSENEKPRLTYHSGDSWKDTQESRHMLYLCKRAYLVFQKLGTQGKNQTVEKNMI